MEGRVTSLRNVRGVVFVTVLLFMVLVGLCVSGTATAEVRDTISTSDAVQYGEGDGIDGSASDAAVTASQVFQEPASTEGTSSPSGSASTDATDEAGETDETIEATPTSEKSPVTEEAAREVKITELPDTSGSTAPLLGVALVAGGMLVGAAGRAGR